MFDWMPLNINSPPTGYRILLYIPGGFYVSDRNKIAIGEFFDAGYREMILEINGKQKPISGYKHLPTHWQILPAKPEQK